MRKIQKLGKIQKLKTLLLPRSQQLLSHKKMKPQQMKRLFLHKNNLRRKDVRKVHKMRKIHTLLLPGPEHLHSHKKQIWSRTVKDGQ